MPAYKYTALFELNTTANPTSPIRRQGGWSESWYSPSANDMPFFHTLLAARAAMLPDSARIVGQRLQQVDPVAPSQSFATPFAGNLTYRTDVPQMALFLRCTSNLRNTRPLYLRGIPDSQVVEGEFFPVPPYGDLLGSYATLLVSQAWRFRGRDLDQLRWNLLAVVEVAGQIRVITELAPGWVANDIVTLSGVVLPDGSKASGKVRILTPLDAFTFPVAGWTQGTGLTGTGVKVTYVYPIVRSVVLSRVVTRRVGRPFTGYRGRRSNRPT